MLAGRWTYRSFRNDPALVGEEAAAALGLIVQEGVLDLRPDGHGDFAGALGMSSGHALTLRATVRGVPGSFGIVGLGVEGTATAGWRYDYQGVLGHEWPDAAHQVPTLLGTVVRTNPRDAGAPASFIAVRHTHAQAPVGIRGNALTAGL
jgi:hypothetical protein